MGLLMQHDPMLATVLPEVLPPSLIHVTTESHITENGEWPIVKTLYHIYHSNFCVFLFVCFYFTHLYYFLFTFHYKFLSHHKNKKKEKMESCATDTPLPPHSFVFTCLLRWQRRVRPRVAASWLCGATCSRVLAKTWGRAMGALGRVRP